MRDSGGFMATRPMKPRQRLVGALALACGVMEKLEMNQDAKVTAALEDRLRILHEKVVQRLEALQDEVPKFEVVSVKATQDFLQAPFLGGKKETDEEAEERMRQQRYQRRREKLRLAKQRRQGQQLEGGEVAAAAAAAEEEEEEEQQQQLLNIAEAVEEESKQGMGVDEITAFASLGIADDDEGAGAGAACIAGWQSYVANVKVGLSYTHQPTHSPTNPPAYLHSVVFGAIATILSPALVAPNVGES